MSAPLSKKQRHTLKFIKRFIAEREEAPSYSEMMAELGIASKGHMSHILKTLEDRGKITRSYAANRSITLVEEEKGILRQIQDAATAFVGLQVSFREAYETDATSKAVKDKAPAVAKAFDHLRHLIKGGAA